MTLPSLLAVAQTTLSVDPRSIEAGLFWIPLIPMLAALFNALFSARIGKGSSAFIACGAVFASFMFALLAFACVFPADGTVLHQSLFTWFAVPAGASGPGVHIELAYAVDRLSSIMLLIITGVGFLIHVYSVSYMSEENGKNFARYFAYLNLFVGMMLTLVMGSNLLVLFVGWEGVGLASYLLIGYWWDDEAKAAAGRKAFVVNRIGDFGFLIGIFVLLSSVGTVSFYSVSKNAQGFTQAVHQPILERLAAATHQLPAVGQGPVLHVAGLASSHVLSGPFQGASWLFVVTLAVLLLFLGAAGKSAQIPLFVWLPDAMAGPTPVSALIHAATMVTAGVYMLCRLNYLVSAAPVAMIVIAFVGAGTALFAATIGMFQDDIKKVLAYSTVSQLGYMILGCGIGAYWAASLHLLTHAFFKACLFLGAGAVMHAMAGETNVWKLGGLRKHIPLTHWTFLIATVAITGVFPLSGFFSKDAILGIAHNAAWLGADWIPTALWAIGSAGAFCTAYYMFRIYFLTFWGERRSLQHHHAHEAGLMTGPLVVLAFLAVVASIWGMPFFAESAHGLAWTSDGQTLWKLYLNPVFDPGQLSLIGRHAGEVEKGPWIGWAIALAIGWAGAALAYVKFAVAPSTNLAAERPVGNPLVVLIKNKYYIDEIYDALVVRPVKTTAKVLWKFVDQGIIDGVLVGGWAFFTNLFAGMLRVLQNGSAQRYAAAMAIGLVIILFASPARDFLLQFFGH